MRQVAPIKSLAALSLAFLLAGCGALGLGGEPSEVEQRAERLRTPPDVLSAREESPTVPRDAASDPEADPGEPDSPPTATRRDPEDYLQVVDGRVVLDTGLPVNAAWAVLGRSLERAGFALMDSDRDALTHQIRYNPAAVVGASPDEFENDESPDRGRLGALAFWRGEPPPPVQTLVLQVEERGPGARFFLKRTDDEPAPSSAARQVLQVVAEQIKP